MREFFMAIMIVLLVLSAVAFQNDELPRAIFFVLIALVCELIAVTVDIQKRK